MHASRSLTRAVRRSLAAAAIVGVASAPVAQGQAFPPIVQLSSLRPVAGGDGAQGSIFVGRRMDGAAGETVSVIDDINGDGVADLVIAAPRATSGQVDRAGELYVLFGQPGGFPAQRSVGTLFPTGGGDGSAGFALIGRGERDYSGESIANVGDLNGDGIHDLGLSADPRHPEVIVLFGRDQKGGDTFPPVLPLQQLLPGGGGDGSRGFALRFRGGDDLISLEVSAAGDVNGDGVDDLLIGNATGFDFGDGPAGEVTVLFGRDVAADGGFAPVMDVDQLRPVAGGDGSDGFFILGIDSDDRAGVRVNAAGDVNGDGIDDLLIGSYRADPGGRGGAGESYLLFGRRDGWPATVSLVDLLPEAGGDGNLGVVVAGIDGADNAGAVFGGGDVNNDGISDVLICAAGAAPGDRFQAGECYAVFGRDAINDPFPAQLELTTLLPQHGGDGSRGFVLEGASVADELGAGLEASKPVSITGDVNGDGIDDIVIGTQNGDLSNGVNNNEGEVSVVFGRDGAFPPVVPLLSLRPAGGGDGAMGFVIAAYDVSGFAGGSVSTGDVNGDGIDDILIGAREVDPVPLRNDDPGVAYLVLGRADALGDLCSTQPTVSRADAC
ncbi:MAG: integrin alpha [Pseudomonadota bacterium]